MAPAWRIFKNIFSSLLFTIIFRPKMFKFHPYSNFEFLIMYCMSIINYFFKTEHSKSITSIISKFDAFFHKSSIILQFSFEPVPLFSLGRNRVSFEIWPSQDQHEYISEIWHVRRRPELYQNDCQGSIDSVSHKHNTYNIVIPTVDYRKHT